MKKYDFGGKPGWTFELGHKVSYRRIDCIDHQTVPGHILLILSFGLAVSRQLKRFGLRKETFRIKSVSKSVYTCHCYIKGLSDVLEQRN